MLIRDLGLSTRSYNCLLNAGINTVDELKAKPVEIIWGIDKLGAKCAAEIANKMKELQIECVWMEEIFAPYSPFIRGKPRD